MMTPAERSKAYYEAHKSDPVWLEAHRERARAYRAKRGTKRQCVDAALTTGRDMTSYDIKDATPIEHVAWIAWQYFRALEKAGVEAPFHPLS